MQIRDSHISISLQTIKERTTPRNHSFPNDTISENDNSNINNPKNMTIDQFETSNQPTTPRTKYGRREEHAVTEDKQD